MNQIGTRKKTNTGVYCQSWTKYIPSKGGKTRAFVNSCNQLCSAAFSRQIYTISEEKIIIWNLYNNFDISDKAAFKKSEVIIRKKTHIHHVCVLCFCGAASATSERASKAKTQQSSHWTSSGNHLELFLLRAGFWVGIARHHLCEISVILPEEVPGSCQKSALQAGRAGRQQDPHWTQAVGQASHPPHTCQASATQPLGNCWELPVEGVWMDPASLSGWALCYQTIPAVGVHSLGKDTQLSIFEFSDIHQSIRMLWKFLTSRDLLADLINIIKLRLK